MKRATNTASAERDADIVRQAIEAMGADNRERLIKALASDLLRTKALAEKASK